MILSALIISVPCVSVTLPSNTASFLASSRSTRSASRLTGFSRSARSAHAAGGALMAQASAAQTSARASLRSGEALLYTPGNFIIGLDLRQQLDPAAPISQF